MGDVHTHQLGEMTIHVLGDVGACYPAESIFSGAEPEAIRAELNTHYPDQTCIGFPFQPILIAWGERRIMLDTGNDGMGGVSQLLRDGLAAINVAPADVSDVLLTHAHADHISGCADDEANPFFPNATYHIHRTEWAYWRQSDVLHGPSKHAKAVRRELMPIADRIETFEAGEVIDGVTAIEAFGHTPGNVVFKLTSGKETLYYLGDTYINPVHIAHPTWDFDLDMDFTAARATRQRLLAEMAQPNVLVAGYHFAFPSLGRVVASGEGYAWEPC